MNSELLHQIADRIEAEPEHYSQYAYSLATECGTAYCIAGWAVALAAPHLVLASGQLDLSYVDPWDVAQDLLGINNLDAGYLFNGHSRPLLGHTVPEALHKMAEMGKVDPELWGIVRSRPRPSRQ